MKTFRELIAWELEQDRKQKSAAAAKSSSELNTTILRKLRYLNSNVSSGTNQHPPQSFSAA